MTQSCSSAAGSPPEGARRRRVSHPSYPCPLCPKVDGEKTAAPGLIRFSFSAKNSSDAATTDPRSPRDARSGKARASWFSAAKRTASPREQPPAGRGVWRHLDSAEPHPRDPPGERPPLVRRQRVLVQQLGAVHLPGRVRVERH